MKSPVPIAAPMSGAEIEALAQKIINRYQPEIVGRIKTFDIERFFELDLEPLTGVRTDYRELPYGIHGFTDIDAREVVIDLKLVEDPFKYRFFRSTTSHESAHAILHVDQFRKQKAKLRFVHDKEHYNPKLTLYHQERIPAYQNPEWQAWRLGKALLMPVSNVRRALAGGLKRLDLAEAFDVNPAFVDSRLRDLKIVLD
jgi:hypothetical protein